MNNEYVVVGSDSLFVVVDIDFTFFHGYERRIVWVVVSWFREF